MRSRITLLPDTRSSELGFAAAGALALVTVLAAPPADYPRDQALREALASGDLGPEEYGAMVRACGLMELTGGGVAVRGFTIDHTRVGICISSCFSDPSAPVGDTVGGYRIESNTFRHSGNGVRGQVVSSDTTVIRDNRFVRTFHAVSFLEASHLQVVDNRISAPEPEETPGIGHVSFAIAVGGDRNLIARNRIEGHPDGILLAAGPGSTTRRNVIRGNTIAVARNSLPAGGSPALARSDTADPTIIGVPLALHRRPVPTAGAGRVSENLVEGNRILGAEGIGIELYGASGNRIVGNEVSGIVPRRPFPGSSVSTDPEPWSDANGSGIWLSPASDDNEIVGNTFADVEAAAVFVEGDSNRVELRSVDDVVRDLGTGNQVNVIQEAAVRGEWVAIDGDMYGAPVPEASLPLLRFTFGEEQGRWTLPGHPPTFRYTVYGGSAPDSLDLHLPIEAPRAWRIPVRSRLHGDTLDVAFPLAEPYDSARGGPPARPECAAPGRTGQVLHLSLVRRSGARPATPALTDEQTAAADRVHAGDIERRTRALVAPGMEGRESGQPGGERAARQIAAWFREAGLEPLGDDGFLQRVPLTLGRAAPTSSLTVGDTTFRVGDDFAIASLPMRTRPATRLEASGEVVLFGPSLGYGPDRAPLPALDVEGKIVAWVALPGPGDGAGVDLIRTYEALHRSGAEAVIALFPGPLPQPLLRSPLFSEIGALEADLYGPRPARPVVLLGPEAFGALFGDGTEVQAFTSGLAPGEHRVRPTGRDVTLSYEIEETTAAPTHNVVGVLRGSDPELRDEAVVYTAHYDAIGTHDGDVYPGAADNALGVAEMIEIADALRDAKVRPRRSLVFLAVGAEERGMLGSLYWTRHPTWPLDRVVADLNMDGGDAEAWGPLHGVIDLTRQATLVDAAAEVAAARGVPLLPNDASGGGGGSSDWYDFLRAGVPAIQLMGIGGDPALSPMRRRRFGSERVHRPGDVIDEGWDWAGPREMAQVYLLLGLRVANADERPRLREGSPFRSGGNDRGR